MIPELPETIEHAGRVDARRSPWVRFFREQGMQILIPLHSSNRPIGILAFGKRLNKKPLQKREEAYLSSLANIAATAIEKCHTIEELGLVNRKLDRRSRS